MNSPPPASVAELAGSRPARIRIMGDLLNPDPHARMRSRIQEAKMAKIAEKVYLNLGFIFTILIVYKVA